MNQHRHLRKSFVQTPTFSKQELLKNPLPKIQHTTAFVHLPRGVFKTPHRICHMRVWKADTRQQCAHKSAYTGLKRTLVYKVPIWWRPQRKRMCSQTRTQSAILRIEHKPTLTHACMRVRACAICADKQLMKVAAMKQTKRGYARHMTQSLTEWMTMLSSTNAHTFNKISFVCLTFVVPSSFVLTLSVSSCH